ncbi:MAG: anti-sigma factor family protein [Aestuariibacter sp.]
MSPEDQELLSAYLDDELDQEQRSLVQRRLLSEPEFNAAYQKLQQVQQSLKQAYPDQQKTPVPEHIQQLLQDSDGPADRHPNTHSAKYPKVSWMLPLAASVAAVFIATSYLTNQESLEADPWPQVAQQLDTTQDMEITKINEHLSMVVLQSFSHVDGRRCREYQRKDDEQVVHAIACKSPQSWQREVVVEASLDLQDYQTATKTPNKIKAFLASFKR